MAGIVVDRSDRNPPEFGPLREEVARRPEDIVARRRLGWALYAAGATDEALPVLRDGCRDFPEDADLRYALALAAKRAGMVDEAAEAFLLVARMAEAMPDPGRGEILHRLATGHHNRLRTGRWGLVKEVWGRS